MTGAKLRQMMETMLPDALLGEVADATGFHQRDRKRNAVKFLRTMLIAASSPSGGRQADIMRHYFEMGVERVVRGSFYDWFGPPLEAAMAKLSEIAMTWARAQRVDLSTAASDRSARRRCGSAALSIVCHPMAVLNRGACQSETCGDVEAGGRALTPGVTTIIGSC